MLRNASITGAALAGGPLALHLRPAPHSASARRWGSRARRLRAFR